MSLTFRQQLTITIIDKAVFGLLLLLAGFAFNRMLESFKSHQKQSIATLKSGFTHELDVARERRASIAEFACKLAAGHSVGSQAVEYPRSRVQ